MKALKENAPLIGLALVALAGAFLLSQTVGQGPLGLTLFLTPGMRRFFRGRIGVRYGGAVIGLAGAITWRLGGEMAALGFLALALTADGVFREEEEGWGFLLFFLPAMAIFYILLGV